jgi:phage gp36-like protein
MYCTVDDVLEFVPEHTLIALTQDDPLLQVVNLEVVKSAIKYASDKIDAAIRGRYPLPLPVAVNLLKDIALDLVRHRLYSRRPDGDDLPDAVKEGKKSAETDLTKISRGEMSLGIDVSKKAVAEAGPWRMKVRKRRFDGGML